MDGEGDMVNGGVGRCKRDGGDGGERGGWGGHTSGLKWEVSVSERSSDSSFGNEGRLSRIPSAVAAHPSRQRDRRLVRRRSACSPSSDADVEPRSRLVS